MPRFRLFLFVAVALLAGCKRTGSAPRYCNEDLSGVWVNASDDSYAYRLDDHGDVVRGKFFRREPDGGEAAPEPGDDPMLIELHRTSTALAGTMRTKGEAPPVGRRCDLEFGIRVSSCQREALQIVVETSYDVRDDCTRQKAEDGGDLPPELTEYRWDRVRTDAGRQ
ncbi:MAG TPA: hypothetical protein VG496_18435 [Myxococcales bacterium]|nr:hypothetical protein [Myxococcales bacterium]